MRETLTLRHSPFYGEAMPPRMTEVEYVSIPHWSTTREHGGRKLRAYEVRIDGETVGKVEQSIESTDREYGRIRMPGKGRVAWSYRSPDGKRTNPPGLYAATRRGAVAKMLGYSSAKVTS